MGALVPDAHKVGDRCSRETPRIANGGAGELGVRAPDGAQLPGPPRLRGGAASPPLTCAGSVRSLPLPEQRQEPRPRSVYTPRAVRCARGWWSPPGLDEARAVMEDSSCLSEASSPVISLGVALT